MKVSDSKLLESLLEKEDEIKRLKKENLKLKESLLRKFMEGDETNEDDTEDETTDESADEGGDGGEGDSDTSKADEKVKLDPEVEADKMNDTILRNLNAPKNLVLDDGTQTKIAMDSNQGNVDIGQDNEDAFYITYGKGNWDSFTNSAKSYSEKVTLVRQTITPLIEKALIELVGNSGGYERVSFFATAGFDDNNFRVTAEYQYQVNLYIVADDEENKAKVLHDQGYIYQTISQIQGISIGSTKIDTDTGKVTVIVSV